jgi:2-oxoglutarate dehydrogenase E2 component (dihydrolipoamide succinyltransferase)
VRRLLAEHRLRPDEVAGSGAGGRITADDVLVHVAARGAPARADKALAAAPASPDAPGIRRVPHSALRRRIAEHMVASLHTAPHVTTVFEADFSAVLAHRERHRAAFAARGAPLTLTAYIIAACVDAIRAVPETNARWTEEALELFERIDIGVGTALPEGGLVVPVIRDVAALDLESIARRLGELTTRAREDRLTPADVRGGTFTISNHGVSGSLLAAPIVINQPQSAILGVGRLERRAVVVTESDGTERIIVRPQCYLTLTIDHRVMDGDRANRFMDVLVRRLADWPAVD